MQPKREALACGCLPWVAGGCPAVALHLHPVRPVHLRYKIMKRGLVWTGWLDSVDAQRAAPPLGLCPEAVGWLGFSRACRPPANAPPALPTAGVPRCPPACGLFSGHFQTGGVRVRMRGLGRFLLPCWEGPMGAEVVGAACNLPLPPPTSSLIAGPAGSCLWVPRCRLCRAYWIGLCVFIVLIF